jgi:hypothetical protein
MNTHLELPADLEAVLQQIAAREKRDVNDVIQDALQRFVAENARAMPSWVGIGEGAIDLSERVNELLFAHSLKFQAMLEQGRAQAKAGKTVSFDAFWWEAEGRQNKNLSSKTS